MVDINHIAAQVKENCDISDAKYSGIYSVCGLASRLRDFYKWEKKANYITRYYRQRHWSLVIGPPCPYADSPSEAGAGEVGY